MSAHDLWKNKVVQIPLETLNLLGLTISKSPNVSFRLMIRPLFA
ncbi:hypothetical protein EV07_0692 [Prochlorococcus sp. MIT 0603]|nr:hypothetical protein EV07_0692 [Prochlorococcus sp. MIT 0603]